MAREFKDRDEAGRRLAERVAELGLEKPVVLALPRGGVPVAAPVAERLGAPLDLLMVRKIGAPGNPELAAGAVVDGAVHEAVFNADLLRHFKMREKDFAPAVAEELRVIEKRREQYLKGRAPVEVGGRDAVVVDDGIATGATMKAALKGLARRAPASITLAVPVAPHEAVAELTPLVDRMICLETPSPFFAVGAHYVRFGQTSDAEVVATMDRFGPGRPQQPSEGESDDA